MKLTISPALIMEQCAVLICLMEGLLGSHSQRGFQLKCWQSTAQGFLQYVSPALT
jgi:hypothetical protein